MHTGHVSSDAITTFTLPTEVRLGAEGAGILSGVLPLAAGSGFAVIGAAVGGAVVLLWILFRGEDRAEARQRAETERRAEALRRAEAERRG
jgi:hypothetical protein